MSAGYSGVSYILGPCLLFHFVLNEIDIDYHDYQLIPTSHLDKTFIGCTQARRQKLFSTQSGFTNASKQTSCRPSMSIGLDVRSQAMKGGSFFIIILSLLNSYITVSISRMARQGAQRNLHLGQSNLFLLKLCKLRYPRLNPCHTNFKCTPRCRGRLLAHNLPGRSRLHLHRLIYILLHRLQHI